MSKDSTDSSIDLRDTATAKSVNNEFEVTQMYPIERKARNLGIVFAHTKFFKDTEKERIGAKADCDKLKSVLQKFNFEITVYEDQEKDDILDIVKKVSQMDHSNTDCLLIIVLTHGGPGMLCAYEETYSIFQLWRPFSETKCPSLKGKPKLFFLQACRGDEVDSGIDLECQGNTQSENELSSMNTSVSTINQLQSNVEELDIRYTPDEQDFLIGYATAPGYIAYESQYGSWFIQEICSVFEKYGKYYDLLTLLTFVSQRVAIKYVVKNSDDEALNGKKQIPYIISTLTKRLYFFPEEAVEVPEKFNIDAM